MTSMVEIQREVDACLTPAKVQYYDDLMKLVADAKPTFKALGNQVHARVGVQFRISTGKARNAEVDVRVAGRSIGTLLLGKAPAQRFRPHKKNFRSLRDWTAPCPWNDPKVASYVGAVGEAARRGGSEFTPEARVEAAFIKEFDASASWCANHELVRVERLAYQVPVPIGGSAKGKKTEGGLGYIDALARFGRGSGFRVFELKKSSASVKDCVLAVRQATTYALALRALLVSHAAQGYRRALTPNREGRVRPRLRFVATPFVPSTARAAVEDACAAMAEDAFERVEVTPMFFSWDASTSALIVSE